MNNVKTILEAARAIIEKPENWTKGAYATDETGLITPIDDDKAKCFCASGAIRKAVMQAKVPESYLNSALNRLRLAMEKEAEETYTIPAFNDTHTHTEVLQAFDKAIELSKA